MIDFGLPWAFLALPLPLLVWWLWPAAPEASAALRVPFYNRITGLGAGEATSRTGVARVVLKSLAWILLVVAAAQPRWIGPPRSIPSEGRDLILALDLSGSMATPDFEVGGRQIDRFSVVRAVAREFALARKGDRVGLVLFGSRAFLQAPVTPDLETVAAYLDEAEVGLAGQETAIGDALGLAVKHLRNRPADERVLVLLSDGANNAGVLEPEKAAQLARDAHVRVYTIGVGSRQRVVSTLFGRRLVPGSSDLDEETLREIARTTGGRYFRADDTDSLLQVYAEIDRLEPTEGEAATVRPERALFHWPLAGAFALTALLGLGRTGSEMIQNRPRRMTT